jgi:hypothetical protein
VPLPAARQTTNLEENQGCRAFQLSPQEASEATLANPAAEGGTMGEKWPRNFAESGDFHVTTWDRRLYFPSEGRRAEDFFRPKNPTASAGFEPANLGNKGQHATSRPPKPLC